jgi:imidazolonepropionase-like amidohydrolase
MKSKDPTKIADEIRREPISRRQFLKLTGITAAGLLVGRCTSEEPQVETGTPFALVNGTLIDGTGAKAMPDAAIIVRDDRITAVGLRPDIEIPGDSFIVSVQGKTILPGFINSHVHWAFSRKNLSKWAREGVTTVRDLGRSTAYPENLFKTRNSLNANRKCARLVAVGLFINVEGGYPVARWGGYIAAVRSPEEARQAVNKLIDAGADVIKTAVESGYAFGRSGWPLLSPDELSVLIETAHERGKPVTAHVTSARDLAPALDAGVDEIAHMVVDELPNELVHRMIETGTRWVPTLELWQHASRKYPVNYGEVSIKNLARFVEAGGEVALGTDYGGAPQMAFELGMPISEIEWMMEAGMTPMQIIVSATKNAARACNMEGQLGTLEVGKLADVFVVDGDPLTDIHALTKVHLVLREGKSI